MARNLIYCLGIEWQIFPFADKINKLPGEKWKYVSSNNQPSTENTWVKKRVHISAWELKDNIRSVILDWRRGPLVTPVNLSAPPCVFSSHCSNTHKGSLPQKKDMYELCLTVFWLHTNVVIKEWKYKLYFYIFTWSSLFFQWYNIQHWEWHLTASGGETPLQEFWGVWSTSSLPLLPNWSELQFYLWVEYISLKIIHIK